MAKVNSLKKTKGQLVLRGIKVKNKIKDILNNERGEAILTGLIFTAILIMAVIALSTPIKGGFSSLGTWFETTIVDKVKSALN